MQTIKTNCLFFLLFFSPVFSMGMQQIPAECYYTPAYEDSDPDLNNYVMERQSWKPETRQFMLSHPNDTQVQVLQRYLKIITRNARKIEPTNISLSDIAKRKNEVFEYGCADEHYINEGKKLRSINGFFIGYPLLLICEGRWTQNDLPRIEEYIANQSK